MTGFRSQVDVDYTVHGTKHRTEVSRGLRGLVE